MPSTRAALGEDASASRKSGVGSRAPGSAAGAPGSSRSECRQHPGSCRSLRCTHCGRGAAKPSGDTEEAPSPDCGGREGEGKEKKENLKPKSVQRKLEETRRRSGRRRGRGADVARTLRGPPGALAAGPGRSGAEPAEEAQ